MRQTDRRVSGVKAAAGLSRRALLGTAATSIVATPFVASRALAETTGAQITQAQRLARFAADIAFDTLPPATIATVKRLVLDTLGCALGGLGSEPVAIATKVTPEIGPRERGGTIIGGGWRASAEGASFVNGTQVRFLDFLDVYFTKDVCHPSENIPPAMACVEEVGGTGRDLIEAIVVGYEAEARICDVLAFPAINMHPASAAGFVVPLVAGKAWRQSAEQMAHGCVLGGARHMSLNSLLAGDLSMAKALAYALSGAEAITAARLAGKGFTGPLASFEWLFEKVAQAKPGAITLPLEPKDWRCERASLKRYPIQYALQAPVEAAVALSGKLQGKLDEIVAVEATMRPPQLANIADPAKFKPGNRETADHSLPACVAMALADGKLTDQQFEHGRFRDADIVALLGKSKATGSEELNARFPRGRPAVIEVTLADGTRERAAVDVPLGDAARPFDERAVTDKFHEQADPVIGAASARNVVALVDKLDALPTLAPLMQALRKTT